MKESMQYSLNYSGTRFLSVENQKLLNVLVDSVLKLTSIILTPCKEMQDCLGFWIPCRGSQIHVFVSTDLDSGFQSLEGLRIP